MAARSPGAGLIVEACRLPVDRPEDNFNPVGRLFYAASTMICVPNSLAGEGVALGAQASESGIGRVLREAGFAEVRRATETPFNLVLEARG